MHLQSVFNVDPCVDVLLNKGHLLHAIKEIYCMFPLDKNSPQDPFGLRNSRVKEKNISYTELLYFSSRYQHDSTTRLSKDKAAAQSKRGI